MNEATSVRGRYNSSVGRDAVKFIINRQLKVKVLCCRIVLGSSLCAFGLHSSEKDFEISLLISNGLPSVKMPLRFEYKPSWKSEHLLFKLITFPLHCLSLWQPDPAASSKCCHGGPHWRREMQEAKVIYQFDPSRHIHRYEFRQPLLINIVICSQWNRFFYHLQSSTEKEDHRICGKWGVICLLWFTEVIKKFSRRKEIFISKLGGFCHRASWITRC